MHQESLDTAAGNLAESARQDMNAGKDLRVIVEKLILAVGFLAGMVPDSFTQQLKAKQMDVSPI